MKKNACDMLAKDAELAAKMALATCDALGFVGDDAATMVAYIFLRHLRSRGYSIDSDNVK